MCTGLSLHNCVLLTRCVCLRRHNDVNMCMHAEYSCCNMPAAIHACMQANMPEYVPTYIPTTYHVLRTYLPPTTSPPPASLYLSTHPPTCLPSLQLANKIPSHRVATTPDSAKAFSVCKRSRQECRCPQDCTRRVGSAGTA